MSEFVSCAYCGQYMDDGTSCSRSLLHDGLIYKRIVYQDKDDCFCHDCNVGVGQYHHLGCDMERCPICGSQLISCGCFNFGGDD